MYIPYINNVYIKEKHISTIKQLRENEKLQKKCQAFRYSLPDAFRTLDLSCPSGLRYD